MTSRVAAIGLAAIVSISSGARAQTTEATPAPVEDIRIEYVAPTGCPGFDTFFGWVRERAPSARLAGAGEAARLFSVTFETRPDSVVGRLVVHEPRKTTETRELQAATCEEAAAALALIVAVAVDPSSMTRPIATERATQPKAESNAAPSPEGAPFAPEPPREQPSPPPASAPSEADSPLAASATSDGWRWLFAVSAEAVAGPAPGLTPALRANAAVRFARGVSPTLRLSVARSPDRSVQAEDGRKAELTWTAGRLEGCVAFPFAGLELEPCAGVEGGVLRGEGTTGVTDPKSQSRPWWAALGAARIRLLPTSILALELTAGALVPLQRDEFVLQPDTLVHKPPPIGAFFGLGAGARFK